MFPFVKQLGKDFVALLYPALCLGCRDVLQPTEHYVCTRCRLTLPETNYHHDASNAVMQKFAGKVPVTFAASFLHFSKQGVVQRMIHALKYEGQKELGRQLGRWYGAELKQSNVVALGADLLTGVPLHPSRLRERGYNQADWIAQGLADEMSVPCRSDVLTRVKFEGSQTRKNRMERWKNVETVFRVVDAPAIANQHVTLVDDVLTTGATLEACAGELLRSGAGQVSIVTIAATR